MSKSRQLITSCILSPARARSFHPGVSPLPLEQRPDNRRPQWASDAAAAAPCLEVPSKTEAVCLTTPQTDYKVTGYKVKSLIK